MKKPIAIAAVAGTLVVAGTAIATPGEGPFGLLGDDPKEERADFARDLASRLDGVSPQQVERALDEVHRERHAEHRSELAKALAAELDGVSEEEAERALERSETAARRAFRRRSGPPRRPGETLARELGVSRAELDRAFRAILEKRLDARLDEAVEEGRLSRSEANRIRERMKAGPPRFHVRRGPGMRGHVLPAPGPPPGGPGFAIPAPPPE